MSLPSVYLDARSYEDLVAEAGSRVREACPELACSESHDPAVTLIELFSWMTSLTIERLDRVPDKLHLALLEMLGIERHGPSAARAPVRFELSGPPAQPVRIHAGTEVGTVRTATDESIVFQVQDDFEIPPIAPAVYVIGRAGDLKEIGLADGVAYPHGSDRLPFAQRPRVGDALYLGFEPSIARLVMQVSLEASMARGAGVNPEDPPLRWEVSQGHGAWTEVDVLADATGGFNYGSGTVEVQCPPSAGIEPIAGRRLHWLRCRIAETTRLADRPAAYQHAPEIYRITAAPIGALLDAEHSSVEVGEVFGTSDGLPGQAFDLRFASALAAAAGETVEVQGPAGDWEPWAAVSSFADSSADDRHFTTERVGGRIRFGPELRDPAGGTRQRGSIPPKGAALRMSRYRHGGGTAGNLAAGSLVTLRSAIPGVASVTNPEPALGGIDQQSVDSVRARAALQIRTRDRAVTTEDYEFLATEASPQVARARRVEGDEPGVTLRILPRVEPADRRMTIRELTPSDELLAVVARHLNSRSFVGVPLRLLPVRFRGVSVVVNIEASPGADTQRIEREVSDALYRYLNPLIGGHGMGWPFGRSLNQGEIYAIVQALAGVEFVKILRLYETDLLTGKRAGQPVGRQVVLEPDEVIASAEHIVRVVKRED